LKDGPNSDSIGSNYIFETIQVNKASRLKLKMEREGGFTIEVK
jgi:hypothetical protein